MSSFFVVVENRIYLIPATSPVTRPRLRFLLLYFRNEATVTSLCLPKHPKSPLKSFKGHRQLLFGLMLDALRNITPHTAPVSYSSHQSHITPVSCSLYCGGVLRRQKSGSSLLTAQS